ncbi:integrin alpha [Holotrichia oblita]|uniref:Integrin alpha n=1 Tax=Holotrichia oblita TaxID=644536 RepID=A0ACB9SRM4_HOLOL|nr:integrin alpha [Holotrichia oblita]
MLVGAPLGQNLQPGTNRSGALFKCPIVEADCTQVETDGRRPVDDYDDDGSVSSGLNPPGKDEIKDGQWLGVNVRSQGPGGKVMVCAHRYITGNLENMHPGLGLCYSLDKELRWDEQHEPCKGRPSEKAHEQFGVCQAGTSLALLDDGTALIGSPGPYTWRGTMFVQTIVGSYLDRDRSVYLGPLADTPEPIDKYSYLGMSVTGGKFFNKTLKTYAAGAPRSHHHGQIFFFNKLSSDKPMNIVLIIDGEQFGSSFGYEILSADLNNDGYDDLIVGAPFYFGKDQGGAVYIYYNLRNCITDTPCEHQVIYGSLESRFGFSMTALGDINKDGYIDVAVGAPYEGGGSIYIYLGGKDGLNLKPSQKLKAVPDVIKTFGYSLSGGLDMDGNGYPDLLVGAYSEDLILLYKTRPIIDIDITINSNELKHLNTSKPGCEADPRSNSTCFSFYSCFSISSAEGNTDKLNVSVKSKIIAETFDGNKQFSRVWFKENTTDLYSSFVEHWYPKQCQEDTVYVFEGIRDILSPIKFQVTYELIENTTGSPILNQSSVKVFEASFQKDCGDDDICQSNLILTATLPQLTVLENEDIFVLNLGEIEEIILQVNVSNFGESAYETELYINHSKSLSYIALDKGGGIQCTTIQSTVVNCSLGNPLPSYKNLSLILRFEYKEGTDDQSELHFYAFVNSTSKELSTQTSANLTASVKKQAEVHIEGYSTGHVVFGGEIKGEAAMEHYEDIGKRVLHSYYITNEGPWHVENLTVIIHWPWQVANDKPQGKWLLYLEEIPTIEGNEGVECSAYPSYAINPLNLTKLDGIGNAAESLIMPLRYLNMPDYNFTPSTLPPPLTRRKRDAEFVVAPKEIIASDGKKRKIVVMDCKLNTAKCIEIRCSVKKLNKRTGTTITLISRIWNSTLVEDYNHVDWVSIISRAQIYLPDKSIEQDTTNDYTQVETIAYPEIRQQEDAGINILIIIGAVLAGILLLVILIVILWKLGFFKRNRVNDPTLSGNLTRQSENETPLLGH